MSFVAVDAQVEKITPARARELLEANGVNRSIRAGTVEAYRRVMQQGLWDMTGEPLQISRTGRLLNGQHRLSAVADSDLEDGIEFLVVTGLDDKAQVNMDQGASRSVADALLISQGHIKNVTTVAAVARWMVVHPKPGLPNMGGNLKRKVSSAEAVASFHANPDIEEAAERAISMRNHVPGSRSALAYSWLHLNRADSEACNEYFGAMVDLSFSLRNDPRKAALRRLQVLSSDNEGGNGQSMAVAIISVITRSWNAWRKGQELSTIPARGGKGGPIPPVNPI